ncbi:uncharacterized protein LOC115356742 [Xyrichtys novacula]|uniref:Uncharacterized protein LOC115356742 n=1 Tax=Xyrichtys novacula TaxID=13765 RepID=A0AAV1HIG7_XYRNO|nr:uncharacterized protein LOC115356742 [Xyrichtys novacula]
MAGKAGGPAFTWTREMNEKFIRLRGERENLFTGARNSAAAGWRAVLTELRLLGKVTPLQAKRKWENLKRKYKDCKEHPTGAGAGGAVTAATWPLFILMDEILGQRPSMKPPDIKNQQQAEARSQERMDRMLALLEKMADRN